MASTVRQGNSAGDWGTNPICFVARADAGAPAADDDIAGRGRLQTGHDPQQRRLAAAAGTEQGDQFARLDVEVDRSEGFQ